MFSPKVVTELRSYVYAYIDPRTEKVFYIGQGKGNRVFSHLTDNTESEKKKIVNELAALGIRPTISILRHGLTPEEAKLVESVCIDLAELNNLSNKIKGKYSRAFGRSTIEELNRRYDAPPASVTEPCIAINIKQSYSPSMTDRQLYERTRGIWPLGQNKEKAKYALSIFGEVILQVYRIEAWFLAGKIFSEKSYGPNKRYEFVGNIDYELSEKYKGKSLPGLFSSGKRFPVRYLNMSNAA